MRPTVYILTNRPRGVLYVGVTSRPVPRIWEHRIGAVAGFTREYCLRRLVYVERHVRMIDAIRREKQLKEWKRAWKLELIESVNPAWDDLWPTLGVST